MDTAPEISVVMSVYNGAETLRETIESVLSQEGVSLEFIIVNDGSIDATGEILAEYAERDPRILLITQENKGLTRALIAGCARARGHYIARQDAGGDTSMPGRFAKQRDLLAESPDAAFVSCGTQFVGPEGEVLYEVFQREGEIEFNLQNLDHRTIKGISSHPSVMMRRTFFERVGGYRAEFPVAQDLDLWMRLSEIGRCMAMPEVLYRTVLAPGTISATRRAEQVSAARTILACARARRCGMTDAAVLDQWTQAAPQGHRGRQRVDRASDDARFYYFLGSVLRKRLPWKSRHYFVRSIRSSALYVPAWLGLVRSLISR